MQIAPARSERRPSCEGERSSSSPLVARRGSGDLGVRRPSCDGTRRSADEPFFQRDRRFSDASQASVGASRLGAMLAAVRSAAPPSAALILGGGGSADGSGGTSRRGSMSEAVTRQSPPPPGTSAAGEWLETLHHDVQQVPSRCGGCARALPPPDTPPSVRKRVHRANI